jgi:hypothetical protein
VENPESPSRKRGYRRDANIHGSIKEAGHARCREARGMKEAGRSRCREARGMKEAARSRCREARGMKEAGRSRCREARGASRGNTVRFTRGDAYSLSSRFGLPSNRTRRSETAATKAESQRSETAATKAESQRSETANPSGSRSRCREARGMKEAARSRCREARGASRGNTVRFTRGDAYSLSSRFGLPSNRTRRAQRQARRAGSTPAGGGPQGKNRTMRCFA